MGVDLVYITGRYGSELWVFYATINNIPVILWRSVLLETTDLPKVSDQLYHIRLYRVHLGDNLVTMADQIRHLLVWFMVFNAIFNNISVILWRSVLLVEETGVFGENHCSVASH
jgi:energy-converting hydrogenase Eha subunit E